MSVPPNARPIHRFNRASLFDETSVPLLTSRTVVEEIFSMIESHSEVRDTGLSFIKTKSGKPDNETEVLFSAFRSYVRQAKTFFTTAEGLHHRASPLLHYYAFMNLAKALLCLTTPDIQLSNASLYHGLRQEKPKANLADEAVEVAGGVFWHLYHSLTGIELTPKAGRRGPNKRNGLALPVTDMMFYLTDIAYDPSSGRPLDLCHFARGDSALAIAPDDKATSVLLAIGGFEGLTKFPAAFKDFFAKYEEVSLNPHERERIFNLMSPPASSFVFFQSKETYDRTSPDFWRHLKADIGAVNKRFFSQSPYNEELAQFFVNTPHGCQFQFPWNEMFAAYVLFFYLGSLVRYYPSYLEGLLEKREAWLIEQIARSSSVTLLRYFANQILGKNYQVKSRS